MKIGPKFDTKKSRLWSFTSAAETLPAVARGRHRLWICQVWLVATTCRKLCQLFSSKQTHGMHIGTWSVKVKVNVKVRTLDIAPLRETPPQKHLGMARVLKGSPSFTCTLTRSSTIGMSHTCLCLPSYSWCSFSDPGGMEGWVGLGGWLHSETVCLPKGSHPSHY